MSAAIGTGAKLGRSVLGVLAFATCLFTLYWAHVRFLPVDVVFYSTLFDVVLATGLTAALLGVVGFFAPFNAFERAQQLVCWLLLGYVYAITVPTVIDRSLSFYILEKMQQQGGGIRQDRFEDLFTRGYSREHQLVAVRLTEQQISGTVVIEGDCVRLTLRGQRLASFSRYFRENLLPRQRRLMDRYTDELTDPFRVGVGAKDAACSPSK